MAKVKVKVVYKTKVEPTTLLEIDVDNSPDKESLLAYISTKVSEVLDKTTEVTGIYISSEK